MSRAHLVAIAVGTLLLAIVWLFVVPLLLDLGDSSGQNAAVGWIVLIAATIFVGWVMFRPPGPQPESTGAKRRPRRGLRRSTRNRRTRPGRDR